MNSVCWYIYNVSKIMQIVEIYGSEDYYLDHGWDYNAPLEGEKFDISGEDLDGYMKGKLSTLITHGLPFIYGVLDSIHREKFVKRINDRYEEQSFKAMNV